MLNTVTLQGRFTRDPDFKKTVKGTSLVDFTLAVKKNNDKCAYIDCVAWGDLAEEVAHYFKKGQLCVVIGTLDSRLIFSEDSTGRNQRYKKIEVVAREIFTVDRTAKDETLKEVLEEWEKEEDEKMEEALKTLEEYEKDLPF